MSIDSTAKLTFCGAARGVTGSCYHLATPDGALVVDCGTFQGGDAPDEQNRRPPPFDTAAVTGVVLTHGHLDHCGRLPLLGKHGFAGPVYGHAATLEIGQLIMEDTARIGMFSGKKPLYGEADVERVLAGARPLGYRQPTAVGPFSIELFDAGHILGSASVRVSWQEGGEERAVLFSGDIGALHTPIIRDPNTTWDPDAHRVDFVITESTYGARSHAGGRPAAREAFRAALLHALSDGGKVLIPAFGIGRTQEILYEINALVEGGQLARVPVVVDGPLGLNATEIYDHHRDCYDQEALDLIRGGDVPLEFAGLFGARREVSSAAARAIEGPAVIIAGSGMCSGGRILRHLAEHLDDPRTDVIFVGYQAERTLGRELQQGAERVTIEGREVAVRAAITTVSGLSAHADQDGLAAWFANVPRKPGGAVFVCHGEEPAARAYGRLLKDRFGARAIVPALGDCAALTPRPA
jgi:metallo-beta-lactamase family protein